MVVSRLSSVFPRPAASDADDVVWTLQTAAVQWQRGLRADAIVWVRKAADTATQLGHGVRAEELRGQAARLAEFLWSDPEETLQDDTYRLLGQMPTLAAYGYKSSVGQPFLYPDASLSYIENFLRMSFGLPTGPYPFDDAITRALDVLLVLHAD